MTERDDSYLYTGITSASSRATQLQKAKEQADKKAKRQRVEPATILINQVLEHEKAKITDLGDLVLDRARYPQKELEVLLDVRERNYRFIVTVQTQINNILREPKAASRKKGDNQ
jgi:hypothetical protein